MNTRTMQPYPRRFLYTPSILWACILLLLYTIAVFTVFNGMVYFVTKKMSPPSSQQLNLNVSAMRPTLPVLSPIVTGPYEILPRRARHSMTVSYHPVSRARRIRRCQTDCSTRS